MDIAIARKGNYLKIQCINHEIYVYFKYVSRIFEIYLMQDEGVRQ